jgi:hypothetical protein
LDGVKGGVLPKDLHRIPPPIPFGELPRTNKCAWSFDNHTRVLYADFTVGSNNNNNKNKDAFFSIDPVDENFLLRMMERNDITVISKGLIALPPDDMAKGLLGKMKNVMSTDYHHKFRRFDTIEDDGKIVKVLERNECLSMKVSDFVDYLELRQKVLSDNTIDPSFDFVDHKGELHPINVKQVGIYMLDLDVQRNLTIENDEFHKSVRLNGILPGGRYCMMNTVR